MSDTVSDLFADAEADIENVSERTYANTHKSSLSKAEAEAVQILHEDGWTVGELEMTFMARNEAIYRAINTGEP